MKKLAIIIIVFALLVPSISQAYEPIDPKLLQRLRVKEGLALKAYRDPGKKGKGDGPWCVGYGHNLDHDIPKEAAEIILRHDVRLAIDNLRSIFYGFDEFPQKKQDALIDMMFCNGPSSFQSFDRAIEAIRNGDWCLGAYEILDSVWADHYRTRASHVAKDLISDIECIEVKQWLTKWGKVSVEDL